MALPLKSGADLYNNQALRLRLHNLGADPTEVGAGLIYFNTSTGLNTSQKARLYTGSAWKTIAFSEDLDVAKNEDFLALQRRVDLLSGEVDTDAIISNMKEVSAFLEGFAEDASLMDYLNTELGKKLDLTGGTINGNLLIGASDNTSYRYLQFARSGYGSRINVADGDLYVSFGGIDANGGLTATKAFSLGNNGIRYASDGKTYHDILTSAGGTMTGSTGNILVINRTSGNPIITFQSNGTVIGRLGINVNGYPIFGTAEGGAHAILHSGNVGEYALLKDGSNKMSAGVKFDSFNIDLNVGLGDGIRLIERSAANAPTNTTWWNTFSAVGGNGGIQIASFPTHEETILYARAMGNSDNSWKPWKIIAFTDSNVASATKLETPRTIWGQSFDGTADVKGAMSNVEKINFIGSWMEIGLVRNSSNAVQDLIIQAGASRPLSINPSGGNNVLIGTTTDNGSGARLQVNGGIYADTFIKFSPNASYGIYRGNLLSARLSSEDVAISAPKAAFLGTACLIGDTRMADSEARMLVYGKTYIEGNLHVTGNIIADGEVSAGGAAEEGGNAGSGAGAFHSDIIKEGATQTTIAHGLGTDDIVVSIYEKDGVSGRWSLILTDVEIVDANNIIVSFGSATTVEHKVVIMGAVA